MTAIATNSLGIVKIYQLQRESINISLTTLVLRYYSRQSAENAMRYISGTKLDERIIRTDWDPGFVEGRQYGRGKSGGQVNKIVCCYNILVLDLKGVIRVLSVIIPLYSGKVSREKSFSNS